MAEQIRHSKRLNILNPSDDVKRQDPFELKRFSSSQNFFFGQVLHPMRFHDLMLASRTFIFREAAVHDFLQHFFHVLLRKSPGRKTQVRSLIRPDFCPSASGFFMVGSASSVIQQSCLGSLPLVRRGSMAFSGLSHHGWSFLFVFVREHI